MEGPASLLMMSMMPELDNAVNEFNDRVMSVIAGCLLSSLRGVAVCRMKPSNPRALYIEPCRRFGPGVGTAAAFAIKNENNMYNKDKKS